MPCGCPSRSPRVAHMFSRAPQMKASLGHAFAAQPPAAAMPFGIGLPTAAPRHPDLVAHMATTAAGVAVGSAVGHTLGHALTGNFSRGGNTEPEKSDITYQEPSCWTSSLVGHAILRSNRVFPEPD
ncbi:coiled-coil-helix-coiled-coil-helix domain-containing protein 2-like [Mesocricetus auratus]|uniref:Coiled-coil-helix-coiled-coil-helix domain-containing protein 2-like n=1 Tax=Mesocricetus auratus TaxID=10036 RepID=A0ABM2X1Q2_MESAU|nr:coiled-coil-helix-coiled-coil-helix domain-containing protein 2-like [Mesocricetus auratus]